MPMPSDAIIKEYIKTNPLNDLTEGIAPTDAEITEATAMIKAKMTEEQISYLTKNIAEPT